MLLNFKTKNFRSFAEEVSFSMVPAPKQTGLDYSVMKEKVNGKTVKGLCSSVIYGPNAAGKTNLIGAMETLRAIVLRGNIRNSEESASPNKSISALELIPNKNEKDVEPVFFSIEFIEDNLDEQEARLKIRFELEIELGTFLDEEYSRKIRSEELYINDKNIYARAEKLHISELGVIKKYLSEAAIQNISNLDEIAQQGLDDEELFLSNGFKFVYSQELVKMIMGWFKNKFAVLYQANTINVVNKLSNSKENMVYVQESISEAAKIFGSNSFNIGYLANKEDNTGKMVSMLEGETEGEGKLLPAELFESYGTIRFVNIFPLLINVLKTGGTLVADEFDASIHPMALMSIINIFHNDNINIHHAQLIFNTHNPIFLNANLFRRDEIKFVEYDNDYGSVLYALSDFKTSGSNGVRKGEDYMKNYFINRYGAIKDVDFTHVFEKALGIGGED